MLERSGTLADDPFGGRRPTSHERRSGLPWIASYHDGPAPWDMASRSRQLCVWHPKADSPERLLDAGCGTARTLFTSPRWDWKVLGVDVAERRLAIAREKAAERRIANRQSTIMGSS